MSEIIKPKEITNKVNVHTFYCDECNKKLIESEEDIYDGYYNNPFEEISVHIFDEWYGVKLCLCEECKKLYINELIRELKKLGFKKERD